MCVRQQQVSRLLKAEAIELLGFAGEQNFCIWLKLVLNLFIGAELEVVLRLTAAI